MTKKVAEVGQTNTDGFLEAPLVRKRTASLKKNRYIPNSLMRLSLDENDALIFLRNVDTCYC